eukprot:COSAG03_NODE_1852_length_3438_cov_1.486673_2_plen_611_part_00
MGGTLSVDKREGRRVHSCDFVKAIESCKQADAQLCVPSDVDAPALTVHPGTVAVVVRVRPLFPHEAAKGEFNVISCGAGGTQVAVHLTSLPRGVGFDGELETHRFEAHHVFDDACSNDDVFRHSVAPLVDFAIGGGQSTAFMFGQTGSGKTYTMSAMYERAATRCFEGLDSTMVRVSFVELVGDSARDLLRSGEDGAPAPVRLLTDAEGCVQLANALELEVTSAQELTGAIARAIELRRQAGTAVHDQSSRSHAVCRVQLPVKDGAGVLTLVDLAGSERNAATLHKSDPKLIREAAQINSSLMALKDCIRARAVAEYANFRASKLTKKRKKKKKKHGAKHGLAEDSELAEDPIRYNAAGRASSQEQVRAYKEYLAATRKGVRAESEKRAKPETRTSAAVDLVLQQKLFRAACQDDAETLRELFNAGASPDVRNANNESLLDLAKGRKRWRAHALIASQLSSRANDGGTEVLVLAGGADGSGPLSPVSPNANRGLLQKGPRKKSNVVDTPPSTSLPSHELTAETTRQPRRRRPSVNEAVNAGSLKLSKFGAQALLGSAIQKAVMQASGAENRHVTDGSIPKPRTTEVLNDPRGNHAQSKPRRRRPSVQETL